MRVENGIPTLKERPKRASSSGFAPLELAPGSTLNELMAEEKFYCLLTEEHRGYYSRLTIY